MPPRAEAAATPINRRQPLSDGAWSGSRRLCVVSICLLLPPLSALAAELSVVDRTLIIESQMRDRQESPVVLAAAEGATAAVAAAVAQSGGQVVAREDDIGYLYVQLPNAAIAAIASRADVAAAGVACTPFRGEASPERVIEAQGPVKYIVPAPGPWLRADTPFTGESSTQALALKTAHPTYDGRGVVIGFVEPADPLLPSMHGALDAHGAAVPKYAFYDIGSEEHFGPAISDRSGEYHWQDTQRVTPTPQGQVTFAGHTYRLPAGLQEREWRMSLRRPVWWSSEPLGGVVLWAVNLKRVWMMTEASPDFRDAMQVEVKTPYFLLPLKSWRPGTPEDASLTWVLQADESTRRPALHPTFPGHGAMVASVMAGNSFLGSEAGGVAPAAQLAVFDEAGSKSEPSRAWIEDIFHGLRSASTDVVEASVSIGDASRTGTNVYAVLSDRLVRQLKKPLMKSQGNFGPTRYGADDMVVGAETFAIGAYVPTETWKANSGFEPSADITPAAYSGWGPARDGGLKPDFLALTDTLSETVDKSHSYDPPFGLYNPSLGTSASAPNAAGLIALLISGAKQTGLAHDAPRVRAALASSSRFLPGVEARVQGHGLIQVSNAWTALRRAATWEPPSFTTRAPIVSAERRDGQLLHSQGRGLFEQGGWSPGQKGAREVVLTRTSGPPTPIDYTLRWHQTGSAFSSPLTHLVLPLNQPITLPVHIQIGAAGSYSAIVDLLDASVELVAHSVMLTVIVGTPLNAGNDTARVAGTLLRPGNAVAWVEVPAGLSALTLRFTRADKGPVDDLVVGDPTGRNLPYNLYGSPTFEATPGAAREGERMVTLAAPAPGLWQFFYEEGDWALKPAAERLKAVPWTMEFSGYRAHAEPAPAEAAVLDAVTFLNTGAAIADAQVQGAGLGSAHRETFTLWPGAEAHLFTVLVPEGATRLEVECDAPGAGAHVGLYVYKKPKDPAQMRGEATALAYYDPSYEAKKRYALSQPSPGTYVIAVDPLSVPAAGLKVTYSDAYFHPLFGEITVEDSAAAFGHGAKRAARVSMQVRARPAEGRQLIAEAELISSAIGSSRIEEKKPAEPLVSGLTLGGAESAKTVIVPVPLASLSSDVPEPR